jgi:hypothetical protein
VVQAKMMTCHAMPCHAHAHHIKFEDPTYCVLLLLLLLLLLLVVTVTKPMRMLFTLVVVVVSLSGWLVGGTPPPPAPPLANHPQQTTVGIVNNAVSDDVASKVGTIDGLAIMDGRALAFGATKLMALWQASPKPLSVVTSEDKDRLGSSNERAMNCRERAFAKLNRDDCVTRSVSALRATTKDLANCYLSELYGAHEQLRCTRANPDCVPVLSDDNITSRYVGHMEVYFMARNHLVTHCVYEALMRKNNDINDCAKMLPRCNDQLHACVASLAQAELSAVACVAVSERAQTCERTLDAIFQRNLTGCVHRDELMDNVGKRTQLEVRNAELQVQVMELGKQIEARVAAEAELRQDKAHLWAKLRFYEDYYRNTTEKNKKAAADSAAEMGARSNGPATMKRWLVAAVSTFASVCAYFVESTGMSSARLGRCMERLVRANEYGWKHEHNADLAIVLLHCALVATIVTLAIRNRANNIVQTLVYMCATGSLLYKGGIPLLNLAYKAMTP